VADHVQGRRKMVTQGYKRLVVIAATVIGLVGLIYLGLILRETEPDYYKPARTALITARQRLAVSFGQESQVLEQLRGAHKNLEAAITALDRVKTNPECRDKVATLRQRLRELEDVDRLQDTSPEQLRESYSSIEDQLHALIVKLERRAD
jgi:phage shock protein A